MEINRDLETIIDNIKISAKESLGYMNWGSMNHGSTKDAQNY
jgi:hypothetical protein